MRENSLSDGTWSYERVQGRQLAKLTKDGTEWTYTYDANGMRTERSGGGETYQYLYSGSQLRQMTVDGHTLEFDYDANGHPLTVIYDGNVYFYVTNLQGDVVGIVDGGGALVAGYAYTAWGECYETGGSHQTTLGKLNPLRYRGYVYDVETGLYYLQSRYYNPEWGRFINADSYVSTGQGLTGNNMFAYCGNDPINRIDAHGNAWETVWDVASLLISVGEVAANPTDPWAWAGLLGDVIDVAIPCIIRALKPTSAVSTSSSLLWMPSLSIFPPI